MGLDFSLHQTRCTVDRSPVGTGILNNGKNIQRGAYYESYDFQTQQFPIT